MSEINLIFAYYLCMQAMIAVASAEVTARYTRWYFSTSRREGLLLRALIIGIAITHLMIFCDCVSSLYERVYRPSTMDTAMQSLQQLYFRLCFLKTGLYIGVITHLVPVWRIVHRYNFRELVLAVIYRMIFSIAIYAGILWHYNLVACFLYEKVACPY